MKAAEVVIEVKNIGCIKLSIVVRTAVSKSLLILNSLKNLDTICTPSEFAMVNKIIGIEVFIIVKSK